MTWQLKWEDLLIRLEGLQLARLKNEGGANRRSLIKPVDAFTILLCLLLYVLDDMSQSFTFAMRTIV